MKTLNNDISKFSDIENYIKKEKINEMYVALHFNDAGRIRELIQLAEKYLVRIKFVPDFYEYTKARKVNIDFYENTPVLMFRKEPLEIAANRLVKKLFDILFSLIVIILVFSWLFPILMMLVKLSSRGPLFFKQLRSGEDNKEFLCWKFRTMRVNHLSDEVQASEGDPRITKIGAFMRRNSLDELPQFWNVLMGDMSVVGPRPHPTPLNMASMHTIDNYMLRHIVTPGITGWAQVNGCRGETKAPGSMQKRVNFDLYYIHRWTFWLDCQIILQTIINLMRGDQNAY
jgi:undecaprenyl-phosphate galactose phosphotransferase/putative colanic acid biosynthesis UDP-glucose lipid carrier transferase